MVGKCWQEFLWYFSTLQTYYGYQSDLVKFEEGFGGVANYNYHSGICEAKLHLPYGYATQLRFNTMQQDLEGKSNLRKA